jgi:AraC family cel operon transcriptional repressor
MDGRLTLLSEKTSTAPFFANSLVLHRIPRFRPVDFFDIMLVTAGTGSQVSYRVSPPRSRALHAGSIALYRPVDDLLLVASAPEGIAVVYVSFPVGEWTTFASMVGLDPGWSSADEPPMADADLRDPGARAPFDRAVERYRSGTPTSLDLVRFWIDVIPTLFPASEPRIAGRGAPDWLTVALERMRDEDNLRIGVPRLLDLVRVSAPHLSATVRRYFGRTPTVLVLEMRLQHAAVLLGTSTESVGQIAQRCGFRSFAYFSTAFRAHYGISPRDYRAKARTRFIANAETTRTRDRRET